MPPATNSTTSSQFPNNFPPLRSLDDFILGSARFQLPNLRDLDKWGNRVVKNLLYYQTNYILLFASIYILMGILYPYKIFCGLFVKFIILSIFIAFFSNDSKLTRQTNKNRWYYLIASIIIGYLLLLWYDAILISAFTLLLPFAATFIHASLRLRNIKNKIVNEIMENFPPNTPMGVFLNSLNVACDKIMDQTASIPSLKKN